MTASRDGNLRGLDATIERRGLRDHVYERILQLLLSGEAVPGRRLSIDTIARQLEVKQTPVREALVQLERTGLVTREALRGYRVAPPLGLDQLRELFDARIMLETHATRLATPARRRIPSATCCAVRPSPPPRSRMRRSASPRP